MSERGKESGERETEGKRKVKESTRELWKKELHIYCTFYYLILTYVGRKYKEKNKWRKKERKKERENGENLEREG